MKAEYNADKNFLVVELSGEIDHTTAGDISAEVDNEIMKYKPLSLKLDFANVTFADSSAIAVVIGRSRTMKIHGGEERIIITNASPTIMKIFSFSGLERFTERETK